MCLLYSLIVRHNGDTISINRLVSKRSHAAMRLNSPSNPPPKNIITVITMREIITVKEKNHDINLVPLNTVTIVPRVDMECTFIYS